MVTPGGLYEFKVMHFELCIAPATFQLIRVTMLAGVKWQSCLMYIGDVVVFSYHLDELLKGLRAVFYAIKTVGLPQTPTKCRFVCVDLKFWATW